ncbi:MAG: hypothetical protein Q4P32_07950 [Micrococcales bacterium]|nr:hypothetical protein [Micrococcales bacterium]
MSQTEPGDPADPPATSASPPSDAPAGAAWGVNEAGAAAAAAAQVVPQRPWPAGHTFERADKICATLIGLMSVYGLAMIPLRPVVLGLAPLVLVTLTGSMTGMVLCGAFAATGATWWPFALVLGTFGAMKFDPVFWWAGKLWGDQFIASMVGPTPRARKRAQRAEKLAKRYEVLAILITYIPFLPIPGAIIYAVLGAAGTSLRRFLTITVLGAFVSRVAFFALGYWIGEPAVAALEEFGKYMWYVSIALVIGVVVVSFRSARKQQLEQEQAAAATPTRPDIAGISDPDGPADGRR